jgi:hypothetical protein
MISDLHQSWTLAQWLIGYLTRERSAFELEEWLVGNLQDLLDSGDQKVIKTANQVDALLIEKAEGLINEDQFKHGVSTLVSEMGLPNVYISSATGSAFIGSEPLIVASTVHLRVSHSFVPAAVGK